MGGNINHKLGLVGLGVPATGAVAQHPWPMFRHDPQYTGRNPYVGPASPVEKWRFEMGAKNGMGFLLMFVKLADKLYSSLETFSHKGEREFPFYLQVDHSPPLMGGDKGEGENLCNGIMRSSIGGTNGL